MLITTAQLLIFVAYVWFIYQRYGKLTSISASTYELEGNQRWLFLGFLWSIAFLNMFQGMGALGFLTSGLLFFTGITINHSSRKAYTDLLHQVATIGAIVLMFTAFWVVEGYWLPSATLAVAIAALYKNRYFIWWIEIVAFGIAIGTYYVI